MLGWLDASMPSFASCRISSYRAAPVVQPPQYLGMLGSFQISIPFAR
jgi:hypothetical protein